MTTTPVPQEGSSDKKVLLVYFSRPGENYYFGDRRTLQVGNTEVLAGMISDRVDCDVYRINPADPYPSDYEETVQRNVREERGNARPGIADELPSLDGYDTVLLGSPVWNVQTPMIMRTFAEAYDWTGRTIHPFVTYAVSGLGNVEMDYKKAAPGARITDGLAVQGETVSNADDDVASWVKKLGLPTKN